MEPRQAKYLDGQPDYLYDYLIQSSNILGLHSTLSLLGSLSHQRFIGGNHQQVTVNCLSQLDVLQVDMQHHLHWDTALHRLSSLDLFESLQWKTKLR